MIIPVAGISIIGWFWFSSETFAQAWNPNGLSIAEGMGSSIALTLWAFLGMESAAQNSNAVENPKRDVPLACMFGTLGAAVIYILSTTVIQGIVPNAELAQSTGPFALAYAHMFNPFIGSIIMALAILACLGSLLGWQFTIAMTGKAAADERMFPAFFTKVNSMGAPVTGMIVLGVVQSALALMTISPTLSEQFSALVNLAVVTNVIPYIISLSALFVMMKAAGVEEGKYRLNLVIVLLAMLYSTYALYASGHSAVMGGMLVMAITFIIWGFLAPRFSLTTARDVPCSLCTGRRVMRTVFERRSKMQQAGSTRPQARPIGFALAAIVVSFVATGAMTASAATLDKVRSAGKITLGYRADAKPFSFQDTSGAPTGYSVELCQKLVDELKADLGIAELAVDWVPVTARPALRRRRSGKGRLALRSRQRDPRTAEGGVVLRADIPERNKRGLSGRMPRRRLPTC